MNLKNTTIDADKQTMKDQELYNAETIAAMENVMNRKNLSSTFHCAEDLMTDLNSDCE